MYNSADIYENIKVMAIKKKVTLKKLTSDCGLGINSLSHLNKGQMMLCDRLAKIADYLDVSVDYLLGRTDKQEINK